MTNFNTDVAAVIATHAMRTSYEVAQAILEVTASPVANQVKSSLIKEDIYAIADSALRSGCYQAFRGPRTVRLYVNGYAVTLISVPLTGNIVINLKLKNGFKKRNVSINELTEFLKEVVNNSDNKI